jgi:hypothetical protein
MPSTVKVRVKAARNLPLPDAAAHRQTQSNTSSTLAAISSRDPYVLVNLGGHSNSIAGEEEVVRKDASGYVAKTKTCKRTVNPVFMEDFR